ncbi:MAG: hypothetical protein KA144_01840 [Xanthomonadaceae bacterium]|nr:hypothetical protein [Xanthomonadaceae bacterium]
MDNVIPFTPKDKQSLNKALANAREFYLREGLSEEDANSAIKELEPLLEPFIQSFSSVMDLPGSIGLSQEQIEQVKSAHDTCVQDIFAHLISQSRIAMRAITILVGAKYSL